MTVTFFGHRDTPTNIEDKLRRIIIDLIENFSADLFYVGNQGAFDYMARNILRELKNDYPHIKYYVVLAYMPIEKKELDFTDYSETIYPDGLEKTLLKYAIVRRNRWMLEQADTVVVYVAYIVGGAAKFKELAEKKGKRVINLKDM